MNIVSEKPGVYSNYDASAVVSANSAGKSVGLAALCETGTAGTVYDLNRYEDAVVVFGSKASITSLIHLLFLNGAARVCAVPVGEKQDYEAAFAALAEVDNLPIIVCDSDNQSVQQALRESVETSSEARRERIAVVCGGSGESANQLTDRAKVLNSERVVLVGPETDGGSGALLAAAVAGAIAGESDPAVPLGGAPLKGVTALSQRYSDSEIDLLVRGGVTPLEAVNGQVSVVRGITTRTKTEDVEDSTWRELTTILVVDDVIPTVRNALRAKFARSKNTEQSRGSIRAQVIVELENKLAREIITGYDGVTVAADTQNPTVCLVDFSFTVAHGINQIWLNAHITL